MKILFSHLKKYLIENYTIDKISNSLFDIGHENEFHKNIIDIEFTPNKGDCLSVLGIARDLNAIHETDLNLTTYQNEIDQLEFNFINESPDFCPNISFLKIEIDGKIKKYKPYLESYFKDLNISKKNFFTDISNYLAYEIGQPTHCYDYTKIKNGISLTSTKDKAKFKTLLGEDIELNSGEYVFKCGEEIINFAGVMGGENTKCTEFSKSVLVECAYFNPDMIIGKSLQYDLNSDAAYKFERGTDINSHNFALRRFIKIVDDHAKIKSLAIKPNKDFHYVNRYIDRDYKKINKILGTSYDDAFIDNILIKLGFKADKKFEIPSWRNDIETTNDLAEEIARVVGYNTIQASSINLKKRVINKNLNSKENSIRNYLINKGYTEIINDPFISDKNSQSINVDNPLDSNRQFLRTNIINSLLKNLDYNEKRQKESIKLFEISDIYKKNNSIDSEKYIAIIISGRQGLDHKNFNKKLDQTYLSDTIRELEVNESKIKEINRSSLNSKIKNKIFYIECNVDDINISFGQHDKKRDQFSFNKASPISEFPSSTRDISISINDKDSLEYVIQKVFQVDLHNLKDIFIFDYYNNVDKNITKIGFRFIFQSNVKTLEEHEIDKEMLKVFKAIKNFTGVEIPGLTL